MELELILRTCLSFKTKTKSACGIIGKLFA